MGLFTPLDFFHFLELRLETGEFKEKVKKTFSGSAKKGKHGYFCVTPTSLPGDFSGFYYFFLVEDMSVMCFSLLTNSVVLNGKERNGKVFQNNSLNNTFANRAVDCWNSLPREMIEASDFKTFKRMLNVADSTTFNPYIKLQG